MDLNDAAQSCVNKEPTRQGVRAVHLSSAELPLSRLTMLVSLVLCSVSLLRLSSALVQNLQLDQGLVNPPFLSDVERAPAPLPVDLPDDPIEDHFLLDTGSYDEDPGQSLQLSGRSMRGPRRCILHQQSCLGFPKLPCCDPCDQCYCRFFNAFCYCRRVGHVCSPRST